MYFIGMFRSLNDCDSQDSFESDLKEDINKYNSVLQIKLFNNKIKIELDPNDPIFSLTTKKEKNEWEWAGSYCYICSMLAQTNNGNIKNCFLCGRIACLEHLNRRLKYPASKLKCA